MQYYHSTSNIQGLDNYRVVITFTKEGIGNFVGYMTNSNFTLPFGLSLGSEGEIHKGVGNLANNALATLGKLPKIGKLAQAVQSGAQMANNLTNSVLGAFGESVDSVLESYTIQKPKGWKNLDFSVSCNYYEGLHSGACSTFKSHALALAKAMLPEAKGAGIDSILTSKQVDLGDYQKILTEGVGFGKNANRSTNSNIGCGLHIGKIINISSGLWMTGAKISAPMVMSSAGDLIVWSVDYSFEFYKQMNIEEFNAYIGKGGDKQQEE